MIIIILQFTITFTESNADTVKSTFCTIEVSLYPGYWLRNVLDIICCLAFPQNFQTDALDYLIVSKPIYQGQTCKLHVSSFILRILYRKNSRVCK